MVDDESIELLDRVRQGDEQAATELFDRYVERLIRLAQSRLSAKLRRRVDAEDVVQSVYRSFFSHALASGSRKDQDSASPSGQTIPSR